MKENLNEEIKRNLELMNLPINENFLDKLKDLFGGAYDKIVDFLEDDEEEVEKKFGEIDNLESDDVEEIAKFYEDETNDDLDRDNSESLKDFLDDEGIKYGDVDSGGDMDKDASIKFKAILKSLKNEVKGINIRITSGNDSFHMRYPNSNHAKGRALDLVVSPKDEEITEKIYKVFCKSREKLKGFSFIDEYKFPSKGATGGHFHISYNPSNIEDLTSTIRICNEINETEDESSVS